MDMGAKVAREARRYSDWNDRPERRLPLSVSHPPRAPAAILDRTAAVRLAAKESFHSATRPRLTRDSFSWLAGRRHALPRSFHPARRLSRGPTTPLWRRDSARLLFDRSFPPKGRPAGRGCIAGSAREYTNSQGCLVLSVLRLPAAWLFLLRNHGTRSQHEFQKRIATTQPAKLRRQAVRVRRNQRDAKSS